jgi:DNA-binding GntR family transcriptional regulator
MLSEKAYKKLKNMIYMGRLQPGQRLVERDLSRTLAVSRIPLRESLVRLESEGLVRSVPNSATYVEDFSPADILEIYSMRLVLEPLAVRLATLRHQHSLLPKLHRLCELMTVHTKSEDWASLDRTDYEFHHSIVEASHHSLLIRCYNNCHIQVTGFRATYSHLTSLTPDATAMEHQLIVESISKWDARAAEEAARDHVMFALCGLEEHLGVRLEQTNTVAHVSPAKKTGT